MDRFALLWPLGCESIVLEWRHLYLPACACVDCRTAALPCAINRVTKKAPFVKSFEEIKRNWNANVFHSLNTVI